MSDEPLWKKDLHDVTTWGADPSGGEDSVPAVQACFDYVDMERKAGLAEEALDMLEALEWSGTDVSGGSGGVDVDVCTFCPSCEAWWSTGMHKPDCRWLVLMRKAWRR